MCNEQEKIAKPDTAKLKEEMEAYVRSRRDSVRERLLTRQLRQLPEEDRFQLIWNILQFSSRGLIFAHSCLGKPRYFIPILERGLEIGNAHSIREWLACVTPHLGVRRVLSLLKRACGSSPQAVALALYHIRSVAGEMDTHSEQALRELMAMVFPKPEPPPPKAVRVQRRAIPKRGKI